MTYSVYVAGTFNVLTEGHKRLLKVAVDETEGFRTLCVYVTNDTCFFKSKEVPVRGYEQRCKDVRRFLIKGCGLDEDQFIIRPLYSEPKMKAAWSRTDVLVCSSETRENAEVLLSKIRQSWRPRLVVLERDPSIPSSTEIIKKSLEREKVEVVKW